MRKLILILPVALLISCANEAPVETPASSNPAGENTISSEDEYDIGPLNQTDDDGLKQGYWIVYGKDDPSRNYPAEAKIEEGNYRDNLKDGEWYYYNTESVVDSFVTYEKGVWQKTVI